MKLLNSGREYEQINQICIQFFVGSFIRYCFISSIDHFLHYSIHFFLLMDITIEVTNENSSIKSQYLYPSLYVVVIIVHVSISGKWPTETFTPNIVKIVLFLNRVERVT